ncbi:MAG: bifunctional [glutamate--ammonia ligase]-adenylyl-L-tyrosine phosphorylase/[glutamate--ammonia-ligase] adenylyltransferase [Nitrospirae bacterium]|nr:bifunctional [glutamate--ammonia ligase]-adenylyl-L-tyrosine phosphorylase/[glutamate--ammonia-ligase] adenylyltransferase [Nitrospirota bacterium]
MAIEKLIRDAASETPEPERALKNLNRLFDASPEFIERHIIYLENMARLFSYSQFLAGFCTTKPQYLEAAFNSTAKHFDKKEFFSEQSLLQAGDKKDAMRLLREIKKAYLLRITLRDITGLTTLQECMRELSDLADAVTEAGLNISYSLLRERFGDIEDNAFSVIALGKLGAGDLNYSSDIDILSVYRSEDRLSSGILLPSGVRSHRISAHEYFCKLTETLTALLHTQTEDGIAYRVDLRLRPNGQKGDISLPLSSYLSYYESWGKTWERMALIRARHIAGDRELGEAFLQGIEPFVWKRSMDMNDIGEIRELKKKIDTIYDANDIKRGYGGIREIEFFVQTFQLLYAGELKSLRTPKLSEALGVLLKEGFLSDADVHILSDGYLFLRRIEHILQMKDDLQTHSLPSKQPELEALAKKAGFETEREFTSELRLKRLKVRDMYNSLLGEPDVRHETEIFFEEDIPDSIIVDYLSFKKFKNLDSALKNINALREQISFGKTIRERTLLTKAVNLFLSEIMGYENKDRGLRVFTGFLEKISTHESYLDLLSKRSDTRGILINTFVSSSYLTRSLLSLENLEGIFEYPDIRMDYSSVRERLVNTLKYNPDPMNAIREFRIIEELKAGLLFLKNFYDIDGLTMTLSMLASTIARAALRYMSADKGFGVIAFGRFGAKGLNIGSDLDLVFVSKEVNEHFIRTAEEFFKFFTEYLAKGIIYRVDMRLRPDGVKGLLINNLEGYKSYYLKSAHMWEIQALLRARPVAGEGSLLRAFYHLKRQILIERGKEINAAYIRDMRSRILHELSKDSIGYDIKRGMGGIGEIEFLLEYLQMKHAAALPILITHNTAVALKRLMRYGIVSKDTGEFLLHAYKFLRTIETFLRFNEEDVLKTDSETADVIMRFLGLKSRQELINQIEYKRNKTVSIVNGLYE